MVLYTGTEKKRKESFRSHEPEVSIPENLRETTVQQEKR
jgi:hypothetical protein